MTGPVEMFTLGLLLGFTGALAPGPTLVATINASVKGGWTAGPKVTFGHMVVEVLIMIIIVAGLSVVLTGYSAVIAVVGGIALIAFGLLTLSGARTASIESTGKWDRSDTGPVFAGLVTSISNPYFWIWWLSVGSALLLGALEGGITVMAAFIVGHWTADLSWYTLVSAGIHKGRFFLGTREYRIVLYACGIFLLGFGIYFLSSGIP